MRGRHQLERDRTSDPWPEVRAGYQLSEETPPWSSAVTWTYAKLSTRIYMLPFTNLYIGLANIKRDGLYIQNYTVKLQKFKFLIIRFFFDYPNFLFIYYELQMFDNSNSDNSNFAISGIKFSCSFDPQNWLLEFRYFDIEKIWKKLHVVESRLKPGTFYKNEETV